MREWFDDFKEKRAYDADEVDAEIARLTAERDEAKAVAVWAVIHGVVFTNSMIGGPHLMIDGCRIRVEDTDDAVFRALVEASEGGRDHG